jgi:succinate-semialdehyde dehydrogenase/glutarate-semialdehyde dehydrogenase
VLLGVQPWNFPMYQVVRFAGPNLVLGNTILLKHASNTPQCALALEQLFADAGAPRGVYTNLFVPGSQVGRIIDSPLVQGASLTGSNRAGASLGEAAGRKAKKSVLEPGGGATRSSSWTTRTSSARSRPPSPPGAHMGQSCVSPKRMIVVPEAYDALRGRARRTPRRPSAGGPRRRGGPRSRRWSSEAAAEQLVEQVRDAPRQGRHRGHRRRRIDRPGAFVERRCSPE